MIWDVKIKKVRNFLFYILVLFFYFIFNLIPRKFAVRIGGFLGKLAFFLFQNYKRQTLNNLSGGFGKFKSMSELERIAQSVFINLGKNVVDVFRLKKYTGQKLARLVQIEGKEIFDKAYFLNRGVLALTGHISNFELLAAWFAQNGYKSSVIGRRVFSEALDRFLVRNRGKLGVQNIPTTAPVTNFIQLLNSGKALGILVDQASSNFKGIYVNFFNKPAYTPIGPFILALRTKSPIIPMAIVRNKDETYRIIIGKEIKTDDNFSFEDKMVDLCQRMTNFLEAIIREYPEQWVWMHNRWRKIE